jgi:hypothetical protein
MAGGLKPSEEIQVSALSAAVVYGIFQLNAPNLADVKASKPGGAASLNTHKSVKTAVWTSAIVISGLALLSKSPTVFIVGGLMTAAEGWKYYHANAVDQATGAVVAPGSAMTGQPTPTLNDGS